LFSATSESYQIQHGVVRAAVGDGQTGGEGFAQGFIGGDAARWGRRGIGQAKG